jgi:Protein of unknown function (DUF2975)
MDNIKTLSRVLRYLIVGISVLIAGAVLAAMLSGGQAWLTIGDERLAGLLQSGRVSGFAVFAIMSPVGIIFLLATYWLQRLFGVYAAGDFFSEDSLSCYLWLVWLKAASFLYQIVLPAIVDALAPASDTNQIGIVIEASALVELVLLVFIVHILREAQRINEENESFV